MKTRIEVYQGIILFYVHLSPRLFPTFIAFPPLRFFCEFSASCSSVAEVSVLLAYDPASLVNLFPVF
jgi:hypothetical protein